MARKFVSVLLNPLFIAALILGGCVSSGEKPSEVEIIDPEKPEVSAPGTEKSGFNLGGFLFGTKEREPVKSEELERPAQPIPRKIPIGTIHLVHEQGGFVLIQAAQMIRIPREAELLSYSQEGKPTGKLRISPESKGNFRVADILQGRPRINDRVMLFGMEGADGFLMPGSSSDPDATEVLE